MSEPNCLEQQIINLLIQGNQEVKFGGLINPCSFTLEQSFTQAAARFVFV